MCLCSVGLLHGDMTQGDRDSVISKFKKKEFPTLVATDVAGKKKWVLFVNICANVCVYPHNQHSVTLYGNKGTAA